METQQRPGCVTVTSEGNHVMTEFILRYVLLLDQCSELPKSFSGFLHSITWAPWDVVYV